jgi:hypothetical protein
MRSRLGGWLALIVATGTVLAGGVGAGAGAAGSAALPRSVRRVYPGHRRRGPCGAGHRGGRPAAGAGPVLVSGPDAEALLASQLPSAKQATANANVQQRLAKSATTPLRSRSAARRPGKSTLSARYDRASDFTVGGAYE